MIIRTKLADKQLRKMAKVDALRLIRALEIYDETGRGDVIKLQNTDAFRLRVGNMRAIFEKIDGILVLQAGYRGNIYERI